MFSLSLSLSLSVDALDLSSSADECSPFNSSKIGSSIFFTRNVSSQLSLLLLAPSYAHTLYGQLFSFLSFEYPSNAHCVHSISPLTRNTSRTLLQLHLYCTLLLWSFRGPSGCRPDWPTKKRRHFHSPSLSLGTQIHFLRPSKANSQEPLCHSLSSPSSSSSKSNPVTDFVFCSLGSKQFFSYSYLTGLASLYFDFSRSLSLSLSTLFLTKSHLIADPIERYIYSITVSSDSIDAGSSSSLQQTHTHNKWPFSLWPCFLFLARMVDCTKEFKFSPLKRENIQWTHGRTIEQKNLITVAPAVRAVVYSFFPNSSTPHLPRPPPVRLVFCTLNCIFEPSSVAAIHTHFLLEFFLFKRNEPFSPSSFILEFSSSLLFSFTCMAKAEWGHILNYFSARSKLIIYLEEKIHLKNFCLNLHLICLSSSLDKVQDKLKQPTGEKLKNFRTNFWFFNCIFFHFLPPPNYACGLTVREKV